MLDFCTDFLSGPAGAFPKMGGEGADGGEEAEPFPGEPWSPPWGRRAAELPLGSGWGGRTGCSGAAARGRSSAGVTV